MYALIQETGPPGTKYYAHITRVTKVKWLADESVVETDIGWLDVGQSSFNFAWYEILYEISKEEFEAKLRESHR